MNKAIIAEIDHAELTIRLMEKGLRLKRPANKTAAEVLEQVRAGSTPADIIQDFEAMAAAAMLYVQECLNAARSVQ